MEKNLRYFKTPACFINLLVELVLNKKKYFIKAGFIIVKTVKTFHQNDIES